MSTNMFHAHKIKRKTFAMRKKNLEYTAYSIPTRHYNILDGEKLKKMF